MALWPTAGTVRLETNGGTAATTSTTTITASGTAHTKGSWATVIASTSFPVDELVVACPAQTFASGTDTSQLMDIGIGAAASERVVLSNIVRGFLPVGGHTLRVPVRIPAGERIAARIQSAVTSATHLLSVQTYGHSSWARDQGSGVATTYGADTATSNATVLTDTGSAHTKTSWTQITASTTSRHRYLLPLAVCVPADNTLTTGNYLVDIGIGGSGSEASLFTNVQVGTNAQEYCVQAVGVPLRVDLPAGTRLSARFQKASSGAEPVSISIIAFD